MIRRSAAALAFVLVAAACGGGSGDLTLDGYVTEIDRIIEEFDADSAAADKLEDFPRDGMFTSTVVQYMVYEATLSAMEAVEPPEAIANEHEQVVMRLADVQDAIRPYLEKASLEDNDEFDPARIFDEPAVTASLNALAAACDGLDRALASEGITELPEACGLLEL